MLASSLGASLSRKPWIPGLGVAFSRSWRGSSSLWRQWSSVKAQGDASRALVPWLGRSLSSSAGGLSAIASAGLRHASG